MKLALLLALSSCAAVAQSNWGKVQSLPVGEEIRASLEGGKSFRGQVQSATDESLVILAANTQQSLARAQVLKVSVKGESHRRRNTLIGLGIGAGAGLGIGAGIDHATCSNCLFKDDNLGKAIFTPIGAVVGTLIGVAWPTGFWHDVYRK